MLFFDSVHNIRYESNVRRKITEEGYNLARYWIRITNIFMSYVYDVGRIIFKILNSCCLFVTFTFIMLITRMQKQKNESEKRLKKQNQVRKFSLWIKTLANNKRVDLKCSVRLNRVFRRYFVVMWKNKIDTAARIGKLTTSVFTVFEVDYVRQYTKINNDIINES